jgi:hypothetical protein
MAIDKKSLKEMFPHLYKELESSDNKVPINAIRKNPIEAEEAAAGIEEEEGECGCEECDGEEEPLEEAAPRVESPDKLRHFNPCAQDFIRRCDTEAQAEEIIAYMQKKGELSEAEAKKMRVQLMRDGVRSFGPKKEEYYYFKEGGIY